MRFEKTVRGSRGVECGFKRRCADQGRVRVWCGGARQEKRLFGLSVKISKRFDKFESRAFGLARGKKRVKVLFVR